MTSVQVLNMDEVNNPHEMFSIFRLIEMRLEAWNLCSFKDQFEAIREAQKMLENCPEYRSRKNSGYGHSHSENFSLRILGQGFPGKKITLVNGEVRRLGKKINPRYLQTNGMMMANFTQEINLGMKSGKGFNVGPALGEWDLLILAEQISHRTSHRSGDIIEGGQYAGMNADGKQMSQYAPLLLFVQMKDGSMKVRLNNTPQAVEEVARDNRVQAAYRTGMKVTIGKDGEPVISNVAYVPRKRSNRRGRKGRNADKRNNPVKQNRQSARWKRSNSHLGPADLNRKVGAKVVEWSQSQGASIDNANPRQSKQL